MPSIQQLLLCNLKNRIVGNKITSLKDMRKAKWNFLKRLPICSDIESIENNLVSET